MPLDWKSETRICKLSSCSTPFLPLHYRQSFHTKNARRKVLPLISLKRSAPFNHAAAIARQKLNGEKIKFTAFRNKYKKPGGNQPDYTILPAYKYKDGKPDTSSRSQEDDINGEELPF